MSTFRTIHSISPAATLSPPPPYPYPTHVIEGAVHAGRDRQEVLLILQRHFLLLGLKGGVTGGAVASLCFVMLDLFTRETAGQASSDQLSALFGSVSVSLPGYLGVFGIVFLVAVLTALTSGLAVKAHLAKAD